MLQMLLIDGESARAERLRAAFSPFFRLVVVGELRLGEILLADAGFDAVLLCGGTAQEAAALLGRGMAILTLDVDGETPPGVYPLAGEDPGEISAAARHVTAARAMLTGLSRERAALQKKLDDLKLLNRAKALLCRTLGFTEARAHKYIEEQAMSGRVTKTEAARRIIATYEN